MEFFETLHMRQSVRMYTDEKVAKDDINALVEAAQLAPVGMHNNKGYIISVISNEEILNSMKADFTKATGKENDPSYGAPLFILVSKTPDVIEELAKYDAACIIENMHLAAADRGLGSVYIHGMIFSIRGEKEWQAKLGLPDDAIPICGLAVGHSAQSLHARPTKENFKVMFAE